jgi:hypothetical protein
MDINKATAIIILQKLFPLKWGKPKTNAEPDVNKMTG